MCVSVRVCVYVHVIGESWHGYAAIPTVSTAISTSNIRPTLTHDENAVRPLHSLVQVTKAVTAEQLSRVGDLFARVMGFEPLHHIPCTWGDETGRVCGCARFLFTVFSPLRHVLAVVFSAAIAMVAAAARTGSCTCHLLQGRLQVAAPLAHAAQQFRFVGVLRSDQNMSMEYGVLEAFCELQAFNTWTNVFKQTDARTGTQTHRHTDA